MDREIIYATQQAQNAVQLMAFYVPLAIAFALIQALTKRVFLSFGDVTMFGSFAAVYGCLALLLQGNVDLTAALLSLVLAIACAAALGHFSAHVVFGPLLKNSAQAFMIASVGFSIVLEEVMRLQSDGRDIWIPPLFEGTTFILWPGSSPQQITAINAFSMGLACLTILAAGLMLRFTQFGRNWRACSEQISLAKLCGVNTEAVLRHTFMLGAGLAAVSGWIAAISYGGTSFSSGMMLGFKAMFAAVIGGFGSLRGAVLGAVSLSVLEVLWSALFSTAYRDVGVFSFIVFVLLLRPEGLAGLGQQRESET